MRFERCLVKKTQFWTLKFVQLEYFLKLKHGSQNKKKKKKLEATY